MLGEGYCVGKYKVVHETKDFYLLELAKTPKTSEVAKSQREQTRPRKVRRIQEDDDDTRENDEAPVPRVTTKCIGEPNEESDTETEGDFFRAPFDTQIQEAEAKEQEFLQWRDKDHCPQKEPIFYDSKGHALAKNATPHAVVTANGTVLSADFAGLVLACYEDDDDTTKVAPGTVAYLSDEQVAFAWLVPNREYNPHQDIREVAREISCLPIDSVLIGASMLSLPTKFKLMPDYMSSLHAWEFAEHPPSSDLCIHLEFYHVPPHRLWRTVLGTKIVAQWIAPYQFFGQQPASHGLEIIGNVMSDPYSFRQEEVETKTKAICDSCRLPRTVGVKITCLHANYAVGHDCACRMSYFNRLGKAIYDFRNQVFASVHGDRMLANMRANNASFLMDARQWRVDIE